MNRILFGFFLAIAVIASVGCNGDKIKQLEQQNADLSSQRRVQDSLLNDFVSTFNAFQENLDMIKEKQGIVSQSSADPEAATSSKDMIIQDIQLINNLLDENKRIIDELNSKADASSAKNNELSRLVTNLKSQLNARNAEVEQLKQQLVQLNFDVQTLNVRVDSLTKENMTLALRGEEQGRKIADQENTINTQASTIKAQEDEMNTAFYIVGTQKELKTLGVLTGSGGFVGLGKTKTLPTNVDESKFTRIDIRQTSSIPVEAKKAQIITSHPAGTYTLVEEGKTVASVSITDKTFWKNSRYLVVVKD
ncbi:MAG: hypothetical protein SF053_17420 [Bacteroidia bacterium]|nr:hypothetical protein [Bacteroidia bacterium]